MALRINSKVDIDLPSAIWAIKQNRFGPKRRLQLLFLLLFIFTLTVFATLSAWLVMILAAAATKECPQVVVLYRASRDI